MKVWGVDSSAAGTGLAVSDGRAFTLKNKLPKDNPKGLTGSRLSFIYGRVVELLADDVPDLAVVEGYNYGLKAFGPVFELGEAGGVIKLALEQAGVPIVVLTPSQRAQFGSGSGAGNKKAVMERWAKLCPDDVFADDNQCDALVLREAGRHLLGGGRTLPTGHLMALTDVKKAYGHIVAQVRQNLREKVA